jgi:hypothetical protein
MAQDGETSATSTGTPLNIPKAIFLEDVDKFMAQDNKTANNVLKQLEELFNKYRIMEMSLLQKKERLKSQIPDIKLSLGSRIKNSLFNSIQPRIKN